MTVERVETDWRLHGVRVVHADELVGLLETFDRKPRVDAE
jgi:hypothetical protein